MVLTTLQNELRQARGNSVRVRGECSVITLSLSNHGVEGWEECPTRGSVRLPTTRRPIPSLDNDMIPDNLLLYVIIHNSPLFLV
ncbi:hypothetical protein KQX54_007497 [Cotesia glomerata]|uniref:Uncharacterized protein n=1 Tax=Cotesia glomerata TaxID=32391 RepID=A0AAV7IJ27_COTGL|nr:hypothetical protein KQX54_007497 [Cotesia glomerata]